MGDARFGFVYGPMSYRFQKLDICLTVGCATVARNRIAAMGAPGVVVPATRLRPGLAMASRRTGDGNCGGFWLRSPCPASRLTLPGRPPPARRGESTHSRHRQERQRRNDPDSRPRRPGLLRGVYHRAGHFGPDPLARDDASGAVLATRHVRVLPTTTPFKKFAPKRERSAERRIQPMPRGTICVTADQCLSGAARAADKCTQSAQLICFRGALAFRRSAAALARALTR